MKKVCFVLFLISSLFTFSQENLLKIKTKELQTKIKQSEGGLKLHLMDSLSQIVKEDEFVYDSIVKQTIDYAFKIDSIKLGIEYSTNHIIYLSQELFKNDEAIAVYKDFKKRDIDTTSLDKPALKEYAYLYFFASDVFYWAKETKDLPAYYSIAERFALKAGDSFLYGRAKAYKAGFYSEIGKYALASKMLNEVVKIARTIKDTTLLSESNIFLADLYGDMGFFEESMVIRNENIALNMHVHEYDLVESHRNINIDLLNGSIDAEMYQKDSLRIQLLERAFEHLEEPESETIDRPYILYSLLRAYSETGNLPLAKQFYEKIQNEYIHQGKATRLPDEYLNAIAPYHFALGEYEKAKIAQKKALQNYIKTNSVEGIIASNELLVKINEKLGDIKASYAHYKAANVLKDSIQSVQKVNALSYYQTLYETEKRDFKIVSQENEISILDEKNKVKQQWLLFGGLGLLTLFSIVYLVRSRKFVRNKQKLQEQFSQNLINQQENERSRLARELHDSVGQKLMLLSKTTKKLGSESAKSLADSTLEEVRGISRGLHPSNLERLGLTESINALVYDINFNTELFFTDEIENIDNVLPKETELHLYRIIQETLSNIVKHSEARAVKIELIKTAKNVNVAISDNGKGFDIETKKKNISLGLKTLFERAKIIGAQMNLDSDINKGTKMTLNIPI